MPCRLWEIGIPAQATCKPSKPDIPTAGAVMAVVYDLANTRWELTNPAVPTSGGSGLNSADFTTVQGQAAYTVAALSGKTIVQVTIGEAIVPVGDYGLAGTTLTFAGFTVPGNLNCVVIYK